MTRQITIERCFALVSLIGFIAFNSAKTFATQPLTDIFRNQNGESGLLFQQGKLWMDLPPSPQLRDYKLKGMRCTAIGGPTGIYEVKEDKLWLIGFGMCGESPSLKDIYGDVGERILADWVTGKLETKTGEQICHDYYWANQVYQTHLTFIVEAGKVTQVEKIDNTERSVIPPSNLAPFPLCERKSRRYSSIYEAYGI